MVVKETNNTTHPMTISNSRTQSVITTREELENNI
jgi:hypothetical protein